MIPVPVRGGAHNDFTGAVTAEPSMSWCSVRPSLQRHADHLALGLLGGLADRLRHLFGFTFAKADAAFLVTDDDEGSKTKAFTTFYGFRNAVDRNQAIGEFRSFVAIATVPAVVISCHIGILSMRTPAETAPYSCRPILVSTDADCEPRPPGSSRRPRERPPTPLRFSDRLHARRRRAALTLP